jgi:starvation-inducible DNA-binding protein
VRIRALGYPALGTCGDFVKLALIQEVVHVPKAMEMVRPLAVAQQVTARTARRLFPMVDKANAQPATDLLTQCTELHERTGWMLRSLLEGQAPSTAWGASERGENLAERTLLCDL